VASPSSVCRRQMNPGLWSASALIGSSCVRKPAMVGESIGARNRPMFTCAKWKRFIVMVLKMWLARPRPPWLLTMRVLYGQASRGFLVDGVGRIESLDAQLLQRDVARRCQRRERREERQRQVVLSHPHRQQRRHDGERIRHFP